MISEIRVRSAKPAEKPYELADARGLCGPRRVPGRGVCPAGSDDGGSGLRGCLHKAGYTNWTCLRGWIVLPIRSTASQEADANDRFGS